MSPRIPPEVIAEDHHLEALTEATSLQLMYLRWHWTVDENNANRVSLRTYATAIGRAYTNVNNYAKGYALWLDRGETTGADECRRRVNMSLETATATEHVAKWRQVGFAYAAREFLSEVRRVRDIARQRAETNGTEVVDEIPGVAEYMYRALEADEQRMEQRSHKHTLRYIEIEGKLDKARRHLMDAARIAEDVALANDERQLLGETLDNLKRLLALMDRAIADEHDRSWVSDLRVLQGGLAS